MPSWSFLPEGILLYFTSEESSMHWLSNILLNIMNSSPDFQFQILRVLTVISKSVFLNQLLNVCLTSHDPDINLSLAEFPSMLFYLMSCSHIMSNGILHEYFLDLFFLILHHETTKSLTI